MTYLSTLHWSRWSAGSARGTGNETIGGGGGVRPIHLQGVFVGLREPRRCAHQRYPVFMRATATRDGITKRYRLGCPER